MVDPDPIIDGSRVETMIETGRKIVAQAFEEFRPIAILAAFSGGNDSVVSTHFGVNEFGASVFHCGTGIGLEATERHILNIAARFRWDLRIARAQPQGKSKSIDVTMLPSRQWTEGETAYEEYVLNFGFPGPSQHARCFQRLKERPMRQIQREIKQGHSRSSKILIISGIRHDESSVRAGYKRAVQKDGSRIWVNPFYWNTSVDFEAYRQEFALPRNPVKDHIGISGECLCGAFAKPAEKEAIRSVDPTMGAYLDSLECRVRDNGYPWGWGESIPTWWQDMNRGQGFLFALDPTFRPMCVGCKLRK